MQGLLRSFFTVSFYTFLSRILGFVRDIFIAKFLGSTVTSDAFFVAFRLPSFFRRVLAEGAYSAALIPVFSGVVIDSKDDHEAADFVENTMSLLLLVKVILSFFAKGRRSFSKYIQVSPCQFSINLSISRVKARLRGPSDSFHWSESKSITWSVLPEIIKFVAFMSPWVTWP